MTLEEKCREGERRRHLDRETQRLGDREKDRDRQRQRDGEIRGNGRER